MIKTKKKLFIVKFTKGNNCFFQFYPSHFSVKDLKTRRIVLQVTKPDGLYPVKLSLVSPRRLLCHLLLLSTLLYPPPLLFGIVALVIHSPTSWDVSPFQTLQVIALPSPPCCQKSQVLNIYTTTIVSGCLGAICCFTLWSPILCIHCRLLP